MRILIMVQVYAPEGVSGAVLVTGLATDLRNQGHQVTVLTCAPNYPYGRVYSGYLNRLYCVEWLDGVRVTRTWSYISPHKTFWRRLMNYGSQSATSFYGGLLTGKPDVVVIFSPPLPLGLSAWLLSYLWRVPWVLQLEDRSSSMTSLPSKTFNIMASARPILAVAPIESGLAQLIAESKCGVTISNEDQEHLAETIWKLKYDGDRLS
jgi:hypothetical protein